MVPLERSKAIIFFMTASPSVISAEVVCEALSEGTEDYCMIVCE